MESPQISRRTAARRAEEARKQEKEAVLRKGDSWNQQPEFINLAEDPNEWVDISNRGVWALSSRKLPDTSQPQTTGIGELLDNNEEKYWQSDGKIPHSIVIEFDKKEDLGFIAFFFTKPDESYIPSHILIELGGSLSSLDCEMQITIEGRGGWEFVDLRKFYNTEYGVQRVPRRAFVICISIMENHQGGRDCRIRHLRVIGLCKTSRRSFPITALPRNEK